MPQRTDPQGNPLPQRMVWRSGYYHLSRGPDGRQRWQHLGSDYPTALQAWARLEGAGQHAQTVAQAVEAYLIERGPHLAPATLAGYRNSAGRLAEVFGAVLLAELRRSEVREWLHLRSAPVSANRDLALLRAALGYAAELGWLESNPAAGIRRRTERPRRRVASREELARLHAAATPLWRAVLAVAVLTGMREGELRLLQRRALTDEGIDLRRSKTGTATLIEWSPALRAAIDAALAAHPVDGCVWVVPVLGGPRARRGGPYTLHGWTSTWQALCRRAGVEGLQFRDLRRTAASAAESLEAARDLLGHTSTAITARVYRPRGRAKPTE